MNPSDQLELVEAGTLIRPGPVGRLARFGLGALCLYALWVVMVNLNVFVANPVSMLAELTLMIVAAICVFNYVVNIGFSKSWNRRPLFVSMAVLALSAGVALVWSGSVDSLIFGVPLTLWLVYFYLHLGVSFVVAALIGTPGCEMRSIPELIGRVTGNVSEEHHCPVAFITRIDAWERARAQST